MSYILNYENLGRRKISGKSIVKELSYKELNRVFKPFYFSELDFTVSSDNKNGTINYGWYSQPFTIQEKEEE